MFAVGHEREEASTRGRMPKIATEAHKWFQEVMVEAGHDFCAT